MASEQDALKRDIAEQRGELARDVTRLERRVKQRYEVVTDWRQILQNRQVRIIGSGLALGLLLALLARRDH